jgi:hypothetical protein
VRRLKRVKPLVQEVLQDLLILREKRLTAVLKAARALDDVQRRVKAVKSRMDRELSRALGGGS